MSNSCVTVEIVERQCSWIANAPQQDQPQLERVLFLGLLATAANGFDISEQAQTVLTKLNLESRV